MQISGLFDVAGLPDTVILPGRCVSIIESDYFKSELILKEKGHSIDRPVYLNNIYNSFMPRSNVKERILESAARLFHQQGYHQTGINQIIKEAEVARGSLYQHFSGKDDLCVEYLEYMHSTWFRAISAYAEARQDSGSKLLGLFDFLEEYAPEANFRGCFFMNIVTELPDTATEIYKTAIAKKNIFRDYIHELVSQHTGKEDDPLGDDIYMLFEGAVSEVQFRKETWPVQISRKIVQRLLE